MKSLETKCIICLDNYLASNPKDDDDRRAALRGVFRAGWLHTDIRADISMVCCTRLHPCSTGDVLTGCLTDCQWSPGSPSRTCQEFALAVISEIGPKAQFQDEFLSASTKHPVEKVGR